MTRETEQKLVPVDRPWSDERCANDAPVWYDADSASGWASGYNAAVAAAPPAPSPDAGKMGDRQHVAAVLDRWVEWCEYNEANFTGWGEGEVPEVATTWVVNAKAARALIANDAPRYAALSGGEGEAVAYLRTNDYGEKSLSFQPSGFDGDVALYTHPSAPVSGGGGEVWPAEREVGRAVYERIEKLVQANPQPETPEWAELDYLSHLAESVEEVGGYDGPRVRPPSIQDVIDEIKALEIPSDPSATERMRAALDEARDAVAFFDRVKAASQDEQIAVGRDHWNRLEAAIRAVAALGEA